MKINIKIITIFALMLMILTLSINNDTVMASFNAGGDPDLESGFPVQSYNTAGTYQGGQALHALIANIDTEADLEIIATTTANGPLYAWKSDGALVKGWPVADYYYGAAYAAAGNLTNSSSSLEVIAEYFNARLNAYDSSGKSLPGWPQDYWGNGYMPPSLADVDGDGLDEIFSDHNDRMLYAYKANGDSLTGWPVQGGSSQEFHTPAIADLDGDGDLEIVSASGYSSGYTLFAFHHTGIPVTGFPVSFEGYTDTFPVIGDVDGDNSPEIIVVMSSGIGIFSHNGELERTIPIGGQIFYSSAPALADFDNDNIPEIVVQTNSTLGVWKGDGNAYPGWPQNFGENYWQGNSSPVVGDVDGDQQLDIVVTLQQNGSNVDGEVRLYNSNGIQHSRFPKILNLGSGSVPAIADVDRDGRNEIIIIGNFWSGNRGFFDKLWVYDLGGGQHGRIEWGQFGGGPEHRGVYPVPNPPSPPPVIGQNVVFLPIISKAAGTTIQGIHGYLTYNGIPAQNIPLELRFYDGINWSTVASIKTTPSGAYTFTGIPSLNNNQSYYVRYQNSSGISGNLSSWSSRSVSNYRQGNSAGMGGFDLSDLTLTSPANNANIPLPATFKWIKRPVDSSERYSLLIYDPVDGIPAYQTAAYLNTDGFILYSLPSGFNYGISYAWITILVGPDGALGIPSEVRRITFLPTLNTESGEATPDIDLLTLDWNRYPDLSCKLFQFLSQCLNTR